VTRTALDDRTEIRFAARATYKMLDDTPRFNDALSRCRAAFGHGPTTTFQLTLPLR
jgi:hypothetical protein